MKKILFNEEARNKLKAGADVVANAVKVTLGPSGRHVVISDFHGSEPIATKDGVTVAEYIVPEDRMEAVGAELIKNVARKTVRDAGDGTTTSTVLAQSMISEGLKMVSAGSNPMKLKKGMDKAVAHIVNNIKNVSQQINGDNDKIKSVASVSANNDSEIGDLIASAFSTIGEHGIIEVEDSMTYETTIRLVPGMRIDKGWPSNQFITNPDKAEVILEDVVVMVTDFDISSEREIMAFMDKVVVLNKPIFLVCPSLDQGALSFVLLNKVRGGLKISAVHPPSAYRSESLEDIAAITGATVISDKIGVKLESAKIEFLGKCDKVVSTSNHTTFIGGKGNKDKIEVIKEEVKALIANPDMRHEHERLKKRLARLSDGVAIMSVGANSETEAGEKKDRVDDAIRATKAAIEEGIVAGGGSCLLWCIDGADQLSFENEDERHGANIIIKACESPLKQILSNCGISSFDSIVLPIKNRDVVGYNAKTMKHEDLFKSGIIDPAKVVRVALENANSIAGMIITTECLNVDISKTNPKF